MNKAAPSPVPTPSASVVAVAAILQALGQSIEASQGRGVTAALVVAIWGRVIRIAQRFAAVAARVAAGTLRPTRPRPARPRPAHPESPRQPPVGPESIDAPPTDAERPDPPSTYPRLKLPDGVGWLCRYVPEAANYGRLLRHVLDDPEMAALIAAAPQLGRILRPLCRMLAVEPMPPLIALPPKPRVRSAVRDPARAAPLLRERTRGARRHPVAIVDRQAESLESAGRPPLTEWRRRLDTQACPLRYDKITV